MCLLPNFAWVYNRAETPDSDPVTNFHLNLLPHLSLSFMQQPMPAGQLDDKHL